MNLKICTIGPASGKIIYNSNRFILSIPVFTGYLKPKREEWNEQWKDHELEYTIR